jgi:hypothetical protein
MDNKLVELILALGDLGLGRHARVIIYVNENQLSGRHHEARGRSRPYRLEDTLMDHDWSALDFHARELYGTWDDISWANVHNQLEEISANVRKQLEALNASHKVGLFVPLFLKEEPSAASIGIHNALAYATQYGTGNYSWVRGTPITSVGWDLAA